MALARETIVMALRELLRLEEFSVGNLAEVDRYNFRFFRESDVKKIHTLLSKLKEDTEEHRQLILNLIEKLERNENRHDFKP